MECVGAPVFGPDGNVIGAISMSSLYKPTEDYDASGRLVCEKAKTRYFRITGNKCQSVQFCIFLPACSGQRSFGHQPYFGEK